MKEHCLSSVRVVSPCQLVVHLRTHSACEYDMRAAVRPARVSSLSAGGVLFTFGSPPDTVDSDNVIDLTHLS